MAQVHDATDEDPESLYSLICLTIGSILFPHPTNASSSLLQRIRNSVDENGPKLKEAFTRASRDVILWTRGGSPLRGLLVISMGIIVFITTMGLVVFTVFLIAVTFNAIIISLLISFAIAGGFLAFLFLSLTAIYIGALSLVVFVISTATVTAIVTVLIASGWIKFFYVMWLGTRGSLSLAKLSVSALGLAISGNSFSRHQDQDSEVNIESSS